MRPCCPVGSAPVRSGLVRVRLVEFSYNIARISADSYRLFAKLCSTFYVVVFKWRNITIPRVAVVNYCLLQKYGSRVVRWSCETVALLGIFT